MDLKQWGLTLDTNTGHLCSDTTHSFDVNITAHCDSCGVNIIANRQLDPMAQSCGAGSQVTTADNWPWSGHYSRQLCSGQYNFRQKATEQADEYMYLQQAHVKWT